jgi:hypothetical protein
MDEMTRITSGTFAPDMAACHHSKEANGGKLASFDKGLVALHPDVGVAVAA